MAAEFATSVASNALGNLATEYTSSYVRYFFCFGKIVEDFRNQRRKLELAIDRLQNQVNDARSQTQVIELDVEDWLTKAIAEMEDVPSLLDEIGRKKCFSWCPAWGWRYCLSKKVAKKTLNLSKLVETCNFQRVGHRAALPGLEFIPSKDFMPSESSNSAFKEIMDALKKDAVNVIGLYGMGGVGKTTLAKEVGRQAKQLFDEVVIVTVSQTPDFNKIQNKIADFLDLKFEKTTVEGRAEQLWLRIKDLKSILIILDDVWEELDLKAVGIPFGDDHKCCKIFLTTRLQQVCTHMNSQKEVQLKILSEDEEWALFKDIAGLKDVSPALKDVAKEVARECQGLPLAIKTMAKALKGESLKGWMAANLRLKDSRHLDNQDVCRGIYSCLKLSYDYLKDDNIQSCFLLCSLYPEDYDISIESLTIHGIGQGLFCDINLIEDSRREIHLALSKLQKSGLLLETDDDEHVRMHDVVRDFAHWITSKGENMFMVKDNPMEWPKSESFGCYTAISLWNCEIDNFPDRLEFSKLKTLILTGENYLKVPSTFFEGMEALRVLFLHGVQFSMKALQFLTNLRTLCFMNCELKNISSLRNVENLEIFALFHSNIPELPEELAGLHRLKSLYFSSSAMADSHFPPNLLSRLASLQELHVTSENNVNLLELNSLSGLTALTLRVSTDQCSQENFVFPKLQSYNIDVNGYIQDLEGLSLRTLAISNFSSSLNAFKELFCNVERLTLDCISMEHKNIVPNVDQCGLKELTSLKLLFCKHLECLIDTTREESPITAFSNLVNLDIGDMTCLKELCHGRSPISFLKKLETLSITDCRQLQSVFQMNGLLGKEESQTWTISNLRRLDLWSLPALESIWKEPTHHVRLQSLKKVKIRGCHKLKSIFSPCLAQSLLHLEKLKISECENLEQVFSFNKEMVDLEAIPLSNLRSLKLHSLPALESIWKEPTDHVRLQSLKKVKIHGCHKLKSIFSPCLAQSLLHLEKLKISECENLEQVFTFNKEMVDLEAVALSNLRSLELTYLPALESIWKDSTHHVSLQSLQNVIIDHCHKLKSIFSPCLAQSLLHLEELEIYECKNLEQVFAFDKEMAEPEDVGLHGVDHAIALPCLKDLRLLDLINLSCFCSETFLISSASLENLQVWNCPKLTNFKIKEQIQLKELYLSKLGNSFQLRFSPNCDQEYIAVGSHENVFHVHGRIEVLFLMDLSKERIIWKDVAQAVTLENLRILTVNDCNGLRCLFPLGSVCCLPKLEELRLKRNSKLEQVFEVEDEAEAKAQREIKFDKLKTLSLEELPSLVDFCPRGYHFVLSALNFLRVEGCPKMTTGFFTDSKEYVHAKTETLRLVEQDVTEGSTITQNVIHIKTIIWCRGMPALG